MRVFIFVPFIWSLRTLNVVFAPFKSVTFEYVGEIEYELQTKKIFLAVL